MLRKDKGSQGFHDTHCRSHNAMNQTARPRILVLFQATWPAASYREPWPDRRVIPFTSRLR